MLVASRTGRPDGVTLYGHRIRERRRALGLTQSALAELARLSVRTVRSAEQGDPVSVDTARCLGSTLRMAYVEIVRPSSTLVRRQLEAHGLAPVRLREPFRPVAAVPVLEAALANQVSGVIVVEGPRGVGKATLVRHLAAAHDEAFRDGIVWVAASRIRDRAMLDRLLLAIADSLGFAARLPDPTLVDPTSFDVAFCRQLWADERLVILADLEDPAVLQPFLAEGSARVVVSTARRWVAESVADQRIEVEPWSDDAIRASLVDHLGENRLADDPEGTRAVLDLIAGLPLHARLVASGLQSSRYRTLSDFVQRVERAHATTDAARDPVVRGLVSTIRDDLAPSLHHTISDLALAGGCPFPLPFACDVLGSPPSATLRVLDELQDAYLVQRIDGDEERFRLAEWTGTTIAHPRDDAIARLLAGTAARLVARRAEHGPRATYNWLLQHGPLIRAALAHVIDRLDPSLQPAPTPASIPSPTRPAALAALPSLLLGLDALIRYAPPQEAGRWLTAGLVVTDDPGEQAQLGWMLAWWWMRSGSRPDLAEGWADWARARASDPDLAVSLALHGCIFVRRSRGLVDPTPWSDADTLASHSQAGPAQRCCARLHAAVARAITGSPEQSIADCIHARDLAAQVPDGRRGILAGAAAWDRIALQQALGVQDSDPELASDAAAFAQQLRPDPTLLAGMAELATLAGLDLPLPELAAEAHYLGLEPADAEAALAHLTVVLAQLGYPTSGLCADAWNAGSLTLASFDISGWPLSDPPGITVPLLLPLSAMRELVVAQADVLLQLVRAHRDDEHPLLDAIRALRATEASDPGRRTASPG